MPKAQYCFGLKKHLFRIPVSQQGRATLSHPQNLQPSVPNKRDLATGEDSCVCLYLCVAQAANCRVGEGWVYAVCHSPVRLGRERVFLQVGRQEAKRGKGRAKEGDCEKSRREGRGRDNSST